MIMDVASNCSRVADCSKRVHAGRSGRPGGQPLCVAASPFVHVAAGGSSGSIDFLGALLQWSGEMKPDVPRWFVEGDP